MILENTTGAYVAFPTPESSRIFGLPIVPADTITSLLAETR